MRIVVADDDAILLELMQTRLDLAGYDVRLARNGRQALDAIGAARPSAIVLDLRLPVIDGFAVLEALQSRRLPPPPILIVTAALGFDDVRRCIALGARDYLAKPFKDSELVKRVNRLVARTPGAREASETIEI
jgi:DNA-binding response OmpR family regulator